MNHNISVSAERTGGQWVATAFVDGKYAASCTCNNKQVAVSTARADAADFAARVLTKPTPAPVAAGPGQQPGRQGGAAKVGHFGLYISRPWSSSAIREAAEAPRQLAPAEAVAA
jgi:hypothetical protein